MYQALDAIPAASEVTLDAFEKDEEIISEIEAIAETSPSPAARIKDDPLARYLDRLEYNALMDDVITALKRYWRQATNEKLPLPLAGWLTCFAFDHVKQRCQEDDAKAVLYQNMKYVPDLKDTAAQKQAFLLMYGHSDAYTGFTTSFASLRAEPVLVLRWSR